jgi:hypothetical protein
MQRHVSCENCGTGYVYIVDREASRSGTSFLFLDNAGAKERATEHAELELDSVLSKEIDPVPCPNCGWFQTHMLAKARKKHLGWMATSATVLFCVALLCVLVILLNIEGPRQVIPTWWVTMAEIACGVSVSMASLSFSPFQPE